MSRKINKVKTINAINKKENEMKKLNDFKDLIVRELDAINIEYTQEDVNDIFEECKHCALSPCFSSEQLEDIAKMKANILKDLKECEKRIEKLEAEGKFDQIMREYEGRSCYDWGEEVEEIVADNAFLKKLMRKETTLRETDRQKTLRFPRMRRVKIVIRYCEVIIFSRKHIVGRYDIGSLPHFFYEWLNEQLFFREDKTTA